MSLTVRPTMKRFRGIVGSFRVMWRGFLVCACEDIVSLSYSACDEQWFNHKDHIVRCAHHKGHKDFIGYSPQRRRGRRGFIVVEEGVFPL